MEALSTLRPGVLQRTLIVARNIWKTAPGLCSILLSLRLAAAAAPVLVLSAGGRLIDAINRTGLHRYTPEIIHLLVVESLALIMGIVSLRAIEHYDLILSQRYSLQVNIQLANYCNTLSYQEFEAADFHDRLARAKNQIATQIDALRTLLQCGQQLIAALGIFISAIVVSPGLLLIQLLGVVPMAWGESYFSLARYRLTKMRISQRRENDYYLMLLSDSSAAKEIRFFGLGEYFLSLYKSLSESWHAQDSKIALRETIASSVFACLAIGIYYNAYIVLITRTLHGTLSVGHLVFLAGMLQRFRTELTLLFGSLSRGLDNLLTIGDFAEFIPRRSEVCGEQCVEIHTERIVPPRIEFINVCFRYPSTKTMVLENISFQIASGERVGIVGMNGSGKSTISKLMMRLYEPTSGIILMNGSDISRMSLDAVRAYMSSVFQDFVRFDLQADLNIGIGSIARLKTSDHFIRDAALRARADGFIKRLPAGYKQRLGRRFAGGVDLSGGQWQRVALARALARPAGLLILDEPTAAVDAQAEAELLDDVLTTTAGKTIVFISHRFSTVRRLDRVVVLKAGRVCEDGTHDQLICSHGEYSRMFEIQARGYR